MHVQLSVSTQNGPKPSSAALVQAHQADIRDLWRQADEMNGCVAVCIRYVAVGLLAINSMISPLKAAGSCVKSQLYQFGSC